MRKHLFSSIIAVLSLIFMLGAAPTPLLAADAQSQVPVATQIIWCSLWSGSNLNFNTNCANIGKHKDTSTENRSDSQSQGSAMTTSGMQPVTMPTYAALGDSVAAGLGLPIVASTDTNTTACGRSSLGYPNLVATNMRLTLHNVSCSGTTVGDLVTSEHINGTEQPAQLDAAFSSGTPTYMSITAGANDVAWSYFLNQCYATNCATAANTASYDALLVALQAKLIFALSSIQNRSSGSPPITAVTGYYMPVSAACVQSGKLSSANLAWIQEAIDSLNRTVQQVAANYSFSHFTPIDFAGHDICSDSSWLQGPTAAAPFHPTAQGQAHIAKDVEAALSQ